MTVFGKTIRIYLKDRTVTGIRFGELFNHTIRAIACPRNRIQELRTQPEAHRPGLYFLLGVNEETGEDRAYIGEAENVYDRLQSHLAHKDFWNEVIFFVSKDENLTKAHVKYLESRAITLATSTKRYQIENGNMSKSALLSEPDKDAMEEFLEDIRMLLGVFGHKVLEALRPAVMVSTDGHSTLTEASSKAIPLFLTGINIRAEALWTDEGFVVKQSSEAAQKVLPTGQTHQKQIKKG